MPIEPYDAKELKLRSISEVMRDLPSEYKLKEYLPMSENALIALRLVKDFKMYEGRAESTLVFAEYAKKMIETRWNETREVEKAIKDGRIPRNRKKHTIVYWGIPPVIPMLATYSGMSAKMIYGPSADISFCAVNDITGEIELIFNAHEEDGVVEDFWFKLSDDEIFDRRHMKLGYKLREIPNRTKNMAEASVKIRDILTDVRNELRPEWSNSTYHISLVYITGVGLVAAISNWNSSASLWDGVNAQRIYGMKDSLFGYEPWPPILNMLFGLTRGEWAIKITQMLTNNKLFLNYFEKESLEFMKKHEPEGFEQFLKLISYKYHQGIALPWQTVNCKIPKYDKENKKWLQNEFIYPKGPRIHYEDLDLSFEEVLSGVLFNITHETEIEDKVTRDHIISIGHGLNTKYLKPPTRIKKKKKVVKVGKYLDRSSKN